MRNSDKHLRIGMGQSQSFLLDLQVSNIIKANLKFVLLGQSPEQSVHSGRVNLIGEHIDYEGYAVLPMAIKQVNIHLSVVQTIPKARNPSDCTDFDLPYKNERDFECCRTQSWPSGKVVISSLLATWTLKSIPHRHSPLIPHRRVPWPGLSCAICCI